MLNRRFLHKRVLNPDNTPMMYRVTRVAHGGFYYRPVDGGGSEFCESETFESRVVKEWVDLEEKR